MDRGPPARILLRARRLAVHASLIFVGIFVELADIHIFEHAQRVMRQHGGGAVERDEIRSDRLRLMPMKRTDSDGATSPGTPG